MTKHSLSIPIIRGLAIAAIGIAGAAGAAIGGVHAQTTTICVSPNPSPACVTSIQQAVDNASPGATITLNGGTYHQSVTITKPLTLQGSNAANTIIDATGQANAIRIEGTTGPVRIANITAENAIDMGILVANASQVTIDSNIIMHNDRGWAPIPGATPEQLASGQGSTCPNVTLFLQGDCGEGMNLNGVTNSVVSNNQVHDNIGGILLSDENGPTHGNQIVNNMVMNNDDECGITLASHPGGAPPNFTPAGGVYNNEVEGNTVTGNGAAGIGIYTPIPGTAAYANIVRNNIAQNNGLPGVALHSHAPGQNLNDNVIIGNTLSGNGPDGGVNTDPTGIVIFSDLSAGAMPITGTVIDGNQITGETTGIYIGTAAINQSAHNNSITVSGMGIDNQGAGMVDASSNFWGCAGGPGSAGCSGTSGTVMTAPPLASAVAMP